MTEWDVFKLTGFPDSDFRDAEPSDLFTVGAQLQYVGKAEGAYSSVAPHASEVGKKFGAGLFLLVGPSDVGTRYLATLHVEAVTEYREYYEPELDEPVGSGIVGASF